MSGKLVVAVSLLALIVGAAVCRATERVRGESQRPYGGHHTHRHHHDDHRRWTTEGYRLPMRRVKKTKSGGGSDSDEYTVHVAAHHGA